MVMIRRKLDLEVVVKEVIRKKEAIVEEVHLYYKCLIESQDDYK